MLKFENYRQHVNELFGAALSAAEPGNAIRRYLRREGERLIVDGVEYDLGQGRILIVSVGKAANAMAEAAIEILEDTLHSACVISKRGAQLSGSPALASRSDIRLMEGSHPVSGEDSVQATTEVIDQLSETSEKDLVLCLISGGTSALLTQPIIPLVDWQKLINVLLASGCTIKELNTVRRQLDRIKGGGLAQLAAPAQCVSLILSDVVGNPLEAIGSGPTVVLSESPMDALKILERYNIAEALDGLLYSRIMDVLLRQKKKSSATPSSNEIFIVGDVKQAATAAAARAMQLGFITQIVTVRLEGEAREVGRVAAAIAKDTPSERCLILGGETTVTLQGDGQGGRNQELALSAAIALDNWPAVAIASVATDGEDGPTPAAGAVVSGLTASFAESHDLTPQEYLDRNDSYSFFKRLDAIINASTNEDDILPSSLVVTGSTGTNVNDLLFILTYER